MYCHRCGQLLAVSSLTFNVTTMKNKKHILFAIAIGFGVLVPMTSCKKFIDIDPPKTQAVSERVFATDQSATAAVVGLYTQMITYNLYYMNGAITVYTGLSADELSNVNPNSGYDVFRTNALAANNNDLEAKFWSAAYKYIYQANAVLEGINTSTGISAAVKDQLRGEILFTRALNYFYLVNLFGDVPLIISTAYTDNSSVPRTPSVKIYQQMVTDLAEAQKMLTASYGSASNLRPGEMAAAALVARIYLFQKDWANAEAAASIVIGSGNYKLETDLKQVFLNTSGETIFQMGKPAGNTSEGSTFNPNSAAAKPTFQITNTLLNSFEPDDQRRLNWLNKNTVNGTAYYYPYKYKVKNSTVVTEDEVVLRLSEVYLIRAEAEAQQNKIAEGLADLNSIRNRAGLPGSNAATQTDLLQAIAQERRVELFAEWGNRWLDLKRTGTIDTVLGVNKGSSWQTTDALYPIPQAEILLNPFLTQNPNY
jgi:hypothetical protein